MEYSGNYIHFQGNEILVGYYFTFILAWEPSFATYIHRLKRLLTYFKKFLGKVGTILLLKCVPKGQKDLS